MTLQEIDAIPRDRWGRPLLKLPNDGPNTPRTPFTRASTLSGAIENSFGLEQWKQRMIVQGLARRPDLLLQAEGADTKGLNKIAEAAMREMDIDRAANLGTHIHALTVLQDAGQTITGMPEAVMNALAHYRKAMESWQIIAGELFVANEQIRCAGTFDRVIKRDGQLYIADIKTGIDAPNYAQAAQVQLAVYAHGTRYTYPGDSWDSKSLAQKGISQERAIMIHLPQDGSGCKLYWIDIAMGWRYAQIAVKVRGWWNMKLAVPLLNGYH